MGESFRYRGRTVEELLPKRMWTSAQLAIAAMIVSLGLGIPLGFFAALKQGSWLDTTTVAVTLMFMSVPIFLTAPGLLILFSLKLDLLPVSGWGGFFDVRIILPAMVMGIPWHRSGDAHHPGVNPGCGVSGLRPHCQGQRVCTSSLCVTATSSATP